MTDNHIIENDFLKKITSIVKENISNEQFGVSELAGEVGMSRSNLLRKIKKLSQLSASQFIRQVRLEGAIELLNQNSYTVSEISYKVGFASTSYFIKCFHDHYGYSPGEYGKRSSSESEIIQEDPAPKTNKAALLIWPLIIIIFLLVGYVSINYFQPEDKKPEKSIAVLPFINDSDDASNVYIINGLMESILTNLQKIEDLRVISRTSVEKYRNKPKAISEISRELNVNYLVEGSGQKIGDQILLNIQLIDAVNDQHLWAAQYSRNTSDIFNLQREIATRIAAEIKAVITPGEEARIKKVPTENILAYDYFLKGLDLFYSNNRDSLEESIDWFEKAIEQDNEFARAYADIAIAYYLLDVGQVEKKYSDQINSYADNALLYDPQLAQSLIAKALFYMHSQAYELAEPYLKKALEYNPNSPLVINTLSDFYTSYQPNTEKYLEYALIGIKLDIASHDSITASFIYLHISNAFIQTGFVEEAEKYINKSLDYNPDNIYSAYVKAYILFAKDRSLEQLKSLLLNTLNKDSTRLDVIQEVGKAYYYLRDYQSSYQYYRKFVEIKKVYNLNIYRGEDAKIGVVYLKTGHTTESEKIFKDYKAYAENDKSIYKYLSLGVYYAFHGDTKQAIEYLRLFSQQDNYHYWTILFLKIDPLLDSIKDNPEFKEILIDIEDKFWKKHEQIKVSLMEKGLL